MTARNAPATWAGAIVPLVFVVMSGRYLASILAGPGALGYDARLYALSARTMLEGGNPWRAELTGGYFAGPPTTLLPFVPFAWLPQEVVAGIWIVGSFTLAALTLRVLRMPVWWLAFPPLFGACMMGSVEVLLLALILSPARFLAPILKPYAVLPLLAERQWGHIALGGIVGLLSLLVLPWGLFLAELPWIADRLTFQSFGGFGATTPLLAALGVVALLSLGWRRALWLATPVLWPRALPHYAVMTLPALPPVVAVVWALPIPGALVWGVVIGAAYASLSTVSQRVASATMASYTSRALSASVRLTNWLRVS